MKLAGVWLFTLGYTLAWVGWQNLSGRQISLVGAFKGQSPDSTQPSAKVPEVPPDQRNHGIIASLQTAPPQTTGAPVLV